MIDWEFKLEDENILVEYYNNVYIEEFNLKDEKCYLRLLSKINDIITIEQEYEDEIRRIAKLLKENNLDFDSLDEVIEKGIKYINSYDVKFKSLMEE